jgi:hypothetical protein
MIWVDAENMSARYRVRERKLKFTPQKRVLGMWLRIASAQPTMQAANEIIRERLKAERSAGHLYKVTSHTDHRPRS